MQYIPYVLLFMVATMLIYGWGLWRSIRRKQDLSNLLSSKAISKIKRELKKNEKMSRKDLELAIKNITASQPFSRERICVTDTKQFLDSLLPYMIRQHIIIEQKENHKIYYSLRK